MELSPAEREAGRLLPESLAEAANRLREVGYFVLESVLERAFIDELRDKALERVRTKRRPAGQANVWAPRERPFNDPRVVANPLAIQILREVLGEKVLRTEYWIKSRLADGGHEQEVHRDRKHLFPELPFALPPWAISVNIALTDFTLENGATELWPGSHLIVDATLEERLETSQRSAGLPTKRLAMPAGSIALRDSRLWHRGMPNRTGEIRVMLDLSYHRDFGQLHQGGEPLVTAAEYLELRRDRARQRLARSRTTRRATVR